MAVRIFAALTFVGSSSVLSLVVGCAQPRDLSLSAPYPPSTITPEEASNPAEAAQSANSTNAAPADRDGRSAKPANETANQATKAKVDQAQPANDRVKPQPPAQSASLSPATPSSSPGPFTVSASALASGHSMAGMVGQVNGKPLYADDVLEPVSAQLAALGRKLAGQTFANRARQIVQSRLREIVIDALILGEAKRDLSEAQRRGLKYLVGRHREKLLRQYGQGSEALARANIKKQTGKSLKQTLKDYRQRRVVQRFLGRKFQPKMNVTRRDIGRYYRDHLDQYQPPVTRRLRLIRVETQAQARAVRTQLGRGVSFKKLAHEKVNKNMSRTGGLMSKITGNKPLRFAPLNRAIRALDSGGWAGPIEADGDQWFIKLEKLETPEGQSLMDAQPKIEKILRRRRYRELNKTYRMKLLKTGSYNSIQAMTDALVEIAVNHYSA